ncbi:unnamed protein product [Closterium sp. NIES-53]
MATQKERSSSNGSPGTTPTPPPASGLQTEEGTATRPRATSTETPANQAAAFDTDMMEKFFSFMSFYEQHQQGAPAQSNNSNNNNATPMSLDGSSYARGNQQQQPTFAPYEPQRSSVSFMPHPQPAPGQEKTLDALQVQSQSLASLTDLAGPVEVADDSGAARGAVPAGAGTGGAETGGAESGGAETGGAECGGAETGCAEPGGVPSRREPLSPQRLREWYSRRCRVAAGAGATGGGAGAGAAGGAGGATEATGGAGAAGGGAGAGAAGGAAGAGGSGGATGATGGAGAVGGGANLEPLEGPGSVSAVSEGATRPRAYYVPLLQQVLGSPPSPGPPPPFLSPPPVQSKSQLQPASPLPGPSPYSGPTRGLTECREPESRPVSPMSRAVSPVRTTRVGRRVSRPRPSPVSGTHSMTLRPSTAPQRVSLPSPPASSLPNGPDSESDSLRAASPTVPRLLATAVTDPLFESSAASALVAELVDFAAACRLDYTTSLVAESESASVCPPSVGGECVLGTDVLEDRQEEFECFAAAVPHLVSMLLAPEGDPDAPEIPTPRSYAEAIEGPYSSQWQAAMDAEMASWKSTRTYVNEVPPPGANIVSGMWIFRVKRPPGSPPAFKARYVARGFSQQQGVDFFQTFPPTPKMTTLRVLLHVAAQRDYELHSLDFSTAFLQGSLHEEIWLRRPPSFTGSFPAEDRDPTGGFRGDRHFASAADEADWDEQNVDEASKEAGPLPYCSVDVPMDDENPRESANADVFYHFADNGYVTPAEVNTNEAKRIGPNFIPDPEAGDEAAYPADTTLPRYTQSGLQILGLVTAVHGTEIPKEPATVQQALGGEHREKWRKAMDKELKALKERNTWKVVHIGVARNKTVLTGKWVFRVKTKADGTIDKFKAR